MAQTDEQGTRSRKALPVSGSDGARQQHANPGRQQVDDGNIVDAEIIGETPVPPREGADSSRSERERLRDRARGFFSGRTRANMADHERVHRIEEERAAADDDGLSERDRLLKLRAETKLAGEQYMASLRDSKLLVPGFSTQERDRELNGMHRVYMQMMMQSCMRPLMRGINPNSIIQSVGMMMSMRLLSQDFREEMDTYIQPLKDKIQARRDHRTRKRRTAVEQTVEHNNKYVDSVTEAQLKQNPDLADDEQFMSKRESMKDSRDDYLSKKWRKRMEDLERRERGHRELFTPESAALTEVALMENAFWKMRDPAQDSDEIFTSYKAMRTRLLGQMADDGLDRQEVVSRVRMIIGERMEYEPELRLMFNGMAHGRVVKSPPHDVRIAGTDQVRSVWTGEFDDHVGHRLEDSRTFSLRRPMNAKAHQADIAGTMEAAMLDGLRRNDEDAYKHTVSGYLISFSAQGQGLDLRQLPPVLQQRMEETEVMLASMEVDHLSRDKQREVYSNAFTDAMENVAKKHPGIDTHLRKVFGEDWQGTLQQGVDDPAGFVRETSMKQMSFEAGPDGQNARHRFDWGYAARQTEADAGDYQPA